MDGRVRGPPPVARAMTYRELLATRVLSVDAYWQELREPGRRTPREIPVPLWPGESLQQYEREFDRWLAARRLSLDSMREDPVAERNYRLEFAQTRVAKPNSTQQRPLSPQRPPYRSLSRSPSPQRPPYRSLSRSPSPPPKRHFIGAPFRRDDRGYVYERRASPDRGRLIAPRQIAMPERNYPRERPQVARGVPEYPRAPEVTRAYDNWPRQRSMEPRRPRQDTRSPPRGSAHRQYVGEAQRWTRSRSKSPEYIANRPASPRMDRFSSSKARRSPSPHEQTREHIDMLRKYLLLRRVLSVDAFRDEMHKLRNGTIREDSLKRPHETMVRIPCILWPGETMAQYTQKFERWLESRKISLPSLRDDPARERSLWHTFAYTRAGASDPGEPAPSNASVRSPTSLRTRYRSRSRSRSRSSSRSTRGSSDRGRPLQRGKVPSPVNLPRRDRSYSPRRGRSRSPPASLAPLEDPRLLANKTRTQLLERRMLELDEFQKEVEQTGKGGAANADTLVAIPVPLHPGESMGLYDHRFWTWLNNFNESKESMKNNPARERKFRMAFAYLRAKRPQSSTAAGAQRVQDNRSSVGSHNKIPFSVLKRPHPAANSQNESERRTPVRSQEPSTKRTRTEVGDRARNVTQGVPSSRSPAEPEVKQEPTLVPSHQSSSGPSVQPTTSAKTSVTSSSTTRLAPPSARGSMEARASSTRATKSVQVSTTARTSPIPGTIPPAKRVPMAARTSAAPTVVQSSKGAPVVAAKANSVPRTTGAPTRTTTVSSSGKSVSFSTSEKVIPENIPARTLPSPSATAPSIKREKSMVPTEPISAVVSARLKPFCAGELAERVLKARSSKEGRPVESWPDSSETQTSQAAPQSLQPSTSVPGLVVKPPTFSLPASVSTASQRVRIPPPATSTSVPAPVVKPAAFSLPSATAPKPRNVVTNTVGKPAELSASNSSAMPTRQETSRPLLQRLRIPTSATFPSVLSPVKKAPRFSLSSPAPPVSTASQAPSSTNSQSETPPNTVVSTATTMTNSVAVSNQMSTSAETRNNPVVAISRVNVGENDSAEAHAAVSESDTTPVEAPVSEVSDAEANQVDDYEEHDGDVMNEDGCCCNKCMRNWAKTLTDCMDKLERNVGELKREVNRGGHTIAVANL